MNLFNKLFKKDSSPTESTARFFRTMPAKNYAIANCVLGDWNDPSRMLEEKSMILDVIPEGENPAARITSLNKLYYENLPVYYSLPEEQAIAVAQMINASSEDTSTIEAEWPKSLTDDTYEKLHQLLKLDFVSVLPIPTGQKPVYVISINKNFWLQSPNQRFSTCGFNTYERWFLEAEFIHADFNTAFKYATIITSRLWVGRGPDNSYYFEERLKEELEAVSNTNPAANELNRQLSNYSASEIDFNGSIIYTNSDLPATELWALYKQEYDRVYNNYKTEFDLLQAVYEVMGNAPFYITKVV
ncbi:MAG: hypothetical protein IPP73_10545 [Chitinophagaceae bacterium]|nr:hypothetical protein [Chitinophagaceae bacterium]